MNERLKKIWNYRIELVENRSLRQKTLKGLVGFLVLMILFTILSRAADSMTIAQVNVVYSEKKSIDKSFTVDGTVIQNQEQAISTLSGIKVKDILVDRGQEVNKGDFLFTLDPDDINEQILEVQYDIQKLELQIADYQSQEEVDSKDKALILKHATENYNTAVKNGNTAISNAYNAMEKARQALTDYQNGNSGQTSSEEDMVETNLSNTCSEKEQILANATATQERLTQELEQEILTAKTKAEQELGRTLLAAEIANIETKVKNEYQTARDQAATTVTTAQQALETARAALAQYQSDKQSSLQADSAQTEESFIEAYNNAVALYNQAIQDANDSKQSAGQSIEEAGKDSAASSTVESTELDLELKQRSLDKLSKLVEMGGVITAPSDGIVTGIDITIGSTTSDNAAIVMADTSAGTRFVAQITAEQQKLLARNDTVTLKSADNKTTLESVAITMMQTNEEEADMIDVTVLLPENTLEIGTLATMEVKVLSDPYSICVPMAAIRSDGQDRYVLIVIEVQTVLGIEYKAERVDVTITNKNAKYAALGEGTLTSDQKVISDSNKEIESGDRIRVVEE